MKKLILLITLACVQTFASLGGNDIGNAGGATGSKSESYESFETTRIKKEITSVGTFASVEITDQQTAIINYPMIAAFLYRRYIPMANHELNAAYICQGIGYHGKAEILAVQDLPKDHLGNFQVHQAALTSRTPMNGYENRKATSAVSKLKCSKE